MKLSKLILFILVIFLFALFEREEQVTITAAKILSIKVSSVRNYYILGLFLLNMIGCFLYRMPKVRIIKVFFVFVFYMFISYFIFQERFTSLGELFVTSLSIIMPLFIFCYFYDVSRTINEKPFYILVIISFLIMLEGYIESYHINLLNSLTDETVNTGYIFLYLLPFFLISKKQAIRISGLLFVIIITIISLKRGGIIAILLGLIAYYFTYMACNEKKLKLKTILGFAFLIGTVYMIFDVYLSEFLDNMIIRFDEIAEDQGSSRLDIYEVTWDMILKSDSFKLFFGHGYNSVIKYSPMGFSAHNDYLEIIYDFGILGFFIYILFISYMIKAMVRMIKRHSEYAPAFVFSFVILIVQSSVSHIIIYPMYLIAFASVWGYILGKENTALRFKYVLNENRNINVSLCS